MDRRQRKTREAIFAAFTGLLKTKEYGKITVGEIIEAADVGRATFYAHFETKDFLLKEFCSELFCHIFDREKGTAHKHIFECSQSNSVFHHLFQHLQRNDNNILLLLTSKNNALFLSYFKDNLKILIENHLWQFQVRKNEGVPPSLWNDHIVTVFVETLQWWLRHGMKEDPETITEYFLQLV